METFIKKKVNRLIKNFLCVVFILCTFMSLIIKASYKFDDSPSFERNGWLDWCCIVFVAICMIAIYKVRGIIQNWLDSNKVIIVLTIVWFTLAISYILLVPTRPFSDMRAIADGAIDFANGDYTHMMNDEYYNVFPGNMRLAVLWGIFLKPFPHSIFMLKIINAVFIYGIIMLSKMIAKQVGAKYYNLTYLFMYSSFSLFLYINSIYFDAILLFFCLLGLYIVLKYQNIFYSLIPFSIAYYIRSSGLIFYVALLACILFTDTPKIKYRVNKYLTLLLAIVFFFAMSKGFTMIVNKLFKIDQYPEYPAVNNFYIGINDTEFGFMDNDFSYDRTWQDFFERISAYGPRKMTQIISKKTFWLWTQGTYQVQRYAFGLDVESDLEKFERKTILTKHLLKDSQMLRRIINALCRAQYLVIFLMMIIGLIFIDENELFVYILYLFGATFLIMLVYELKSRYILHLLPFMIMEAVEMMTIMDKVKYRLKRQYDVGKDKN